MTPPAALPPCPLSIDDLTLSRGGRLLFEAVSIRVLELQTLLIRGPNGAGKSSLLLTLAGILRPDRGRIAWDIGDEPQIHLFGHLSGIKSRLTVGENLDFWRAVNGPTGIAPAAALDTVGLGGLDDIEAGHLSAGQTRRLALARLLVSKRRVWLLDEPLASLDAAGDALVSRLLIDHVASNGVAIVATHDDIPGVLNPVTLTLGAAP